MQLDASSSNQMETRPYLSQLGVDCCGSVGNTYPHLSQSYQPHKGLGGSAEGGHLLGVHCGSTTGIVHICGSAAETGHTISPVYEALPARAVGPQNHGPVPLHFPKPTIGNGQYDVSYHGSDISVSSGICDAVETGPILSGLPRPTSGSAIFGASQLGVAHDLTDSSIFVQDEGFMDPDIFRPLYQYPGTMGGQNVFAPISNDEANRPGAVVYQMNGFFVESPVPLPQSSTQWARSNEMEHSSPYLSVSGVAGEPFPLDTRDVSMNASPVLNYAAMEDSFNWVRIGAIDNTALSTVIASTANTSHLEVASIPQAPPAPIAHFSCSYCQQTFRRDADRVRHENSKHHSIPGAHVCPINGCPKNQGQGFSRADKLTEHMWKKHGNLGYTKRV